MSAEDLPCARWWRGDDGKLHSCALPYGHGPEHGPECTCSCARSYSETVDER